MCNIYAIPFKTNRVTKLNTSTQEISKVVNHYNGWYEWSGGALHSNVFIYRIP